MITIYHNPRCSKSRQTLELIKNKHEPIVIEYLKTPPNKDQLQQLLKLLSCSVRDIIRKTESEYKENNIADINLSDDELLDSIVKYPKLLQRPIVINKDKAVIGRPPENVLSII